VTVALVTSASGRPPPQRTGVRGLVLAAGAGTRYGGPKALARDADGVPWVERVVAAVRDGGCDDVLVVLGAGADQARPLVPRGTAVVEAADWAHGLARSLAAGLEHALGWTGAGRDALVVVPVDVPDLPPAAVSRVVAAAGEAGPRRASALVRATHGGRPGHPVLLGADHWRGLLARLPARAAGGGPSGPLDDAGAGPHLAALAVAAGTTVVTVACDDLWDGLDVDAGPGGAGAPSSAPGPSGQHPR